MLFRSSHPDNTARYHIAWMVDHGYAWKYDKEKNHGVPFAESMSLVCRLELHKVGEDYRLFRTPTENIDKLRCGAESFAADTELFVPGDCEFTLPTDNDITVKVGENGFTYERASGKICFTSGKSYTPKHADKIKMRVITDVRSVEFFIADEVSATFTDAADKKTLHIDGAEVSGTKWKMRGIWA